MSKPLYYKVFFICDGEKLEISLSAFNKVASRQWPFWYRQDRDVPFPVFKNILQNVCKDHGMQTSDFEKLAVSPANIFVETRWYRYRAVHVAVPPEVRLPPGLTRKPTKKKASKEEDPLAA